MKTLKEIEKLDRFVIQKKGIDGGYGLAFLYGTRAKPACVVFSWGGGWEHVSVSFANRTPTWDEMCKIKDMFWNEDECVVQYHPPKSDYVNVHPYCLHLWKPIGKEIITPPKDFV